MLNFKEKLANAEKSIKTADHMTYVTYPVIKDKRLLLKILQETHNAMSICINAILTKEQNQRKIILYQEERLNLRLFKERYAERLGFTKEEMTSVLELSDFLEKHRESPFEFGKEGKIVMFTSTSRPIVMSIEKTKQLMAAAKSIFQKTVRFLSDF